MLRPLALLSALSLIGCGGLRDSSSADLGDDVDYAAESADTVGHGQAPDSLSTSKALASLFVLEDPTLDPSRTPGQNADAVAQQLTSAVMIASCANATITHTTGSLMVSVDFGSGCTLPGIGAISGSASATIAKLAGTITVALTLTNITVNGNAVSGTVTLATSDGTTFNFMMSVSTARQQVTFKGGAVLDAGGKGVTLDGSGTSQMGAAMLAYTMTGVHHEFAACYADAGTMTVMKTTHNKRDLAVTLQETITFSTTTPSTGAVTVTIDGVSTPATLPAIGTCPHA